MPRQLSRRVKGLLMHALKQSGTYSPDATLPFIEEQLTGDNYATLWLFLKWAQENCKQFGHANVDAQYAEFRGPVRKQVRPMED